ncbi:MAG: hypothetical protein AAF788_01240 [Pseudomonadota bacterium]
MAKDADTASPNTRKNSGSKPENREERLARALRDNLRRRKAKKD